MPMGEDEEDKPKKTKTIKKRSMKLLLVAISLRDVTAKYGPDAKIGDVKEKKEGKVEEYMDPRDDVHKRKSKTLDQVKADEKEKKVQEVSTMAGGGAEGHAGTRRRK